MHHYKVFDARGGVRMISQESTWNTFGNALISQVPSQCVLVIMHSASILLVFVTLKLMFTTDAVAIAAWEWSGFASFRHLQVLNLQQYSVLEQMLESLPNPTPSVPSPLCTVEGEEHIDKLLISQDNTI